MRTIVVLSAFLGIGCSAFATSRPTAYTVARPINITALNFAGERVPFEFRVDGIRIVDTTVRIGDLPPVVLGLQMWATPGRHLLELYDRRNGEYHSQMFDVRLTDMTIEIRLFKGRAELKTYYTLVVYE